MSFDTDMGEDLELSTPDEIIEDDLSDNDLPADEENPEAGSDAGRNTGDAEISISFGDDPKPDADDIYAETAQDTALVKHLRKVARDNARKAKERERELEQLRAPQVPQLRDRPTLEAHDYDEEAYAADYEAYIMEKNSHDARQQEVESQQAKVIAEQKARIDTYNANKVKLGAKDYDQAEAEVSDILNPVQQAILLDVSDKAEQIVYGLYKNPALLDRLAKIENPARFAAEIGKLEDKLKVSKTSSKPPPPDVGLSNSAPRISSDKKLEALEKEAERTGDRTKVQAYRRELKAKGK